MSKNTMIMPRNFTLMVLIALVLGGAAGVILKQIALPEGISYVLIDGILHGGGVVFINLLKMLVVPVVFVSMVCGVSSLGSVNKLGRIGLKTFVLYLLTTILALVIGLTVATIFKVGSGANLAATSTFTINTAPSLKEVLLNIIPSNPVEAMASGNMLQLIVFSLLLGMSMLMAGRHGKAVLRIFIHFNTILNKLIYIVMVIAPYGIFFLMAALFARQGIEVMFGLLQYFLAVFFVLLFHLFVSYSLILKLYGKLNPIKFFEKMYSAMVFAFSVSSSNASIPVVLDTVETKLGVDNSVAAFVIPLGATVNMDGTAIMQSIATIFIAHAYQIDIGMAGYLTVILMATLASIGAAGVPSVGLITLTMVLDQVGLPTEGIALIIGVDRILDMLRTTVNISGDAMIACLVGRSENLLDQKIYNK